MTQHADTGVQLWNDKGTFIDPQGRYVRVAWQTNFAGSGDNSTRIQITNEGTTLKLRRVQHSISQGADDGRAFVNGSHRAGTDTYLSANQQFLDQFGCGDVNGRGRTHKITDFDDEIAPYLDSNDEHYFRHVGDSASTDETKTYVTLYYVVDDGNTSSSTKL